MTILKNIFLSIFLLSLFGCANEQPSRVSQKNKFAVAAKNIKNEFNEYWYQGLAEITSYDLEQARYGEIHKGSAVMVFVTEDFSKKKLVKMDNPSANPKDAVSILKLNKTRKFNTGIYPYSIMLSTFTPVNYKKNPNTLKVTNSSQEWCGHTFMQLGLSGNKYSGELFSYFESEGDQQFKLEKTILEDELWSIIRINPMNLPRGEFDIIPSTTYARLKHINYKVEKAVGVLEDLEDVYVYSLDYKDLGRKLSITFEKDFPHQIISWEETHKSGFGAGAKTLTTKATRKKSIMLDYWNKNNVADLPYREKLGLD